MVDALLATSAKIHRLTLVTRNVADVAGLGADLLKARQR
jgi:predicted nucleic acid-binding protein